MTLLNLVINIDTMRKLFKFVNVRSNAGALNVFDGPSKKTR